MLKYLQSNVLFKINDNSTHQFNEQEDPSGQLDATIIISNLVICRGNSKM